MPVSLAVLVFGGVLLGAVIQGIAGYGFGFVVVPVAAFAIPESMPAGPIILGLPLSLWMAIRERGQLDTAGIKYVIGGRVPATVIAATVVAIASLRLLLVLAGASILVTAWLGLREPPAELTARTQFAAGVASGLMGTIAAAGGPPVAFVYRGSALAQLRPTLALLHLVGSLMSLVALGFVDAFSWREAVLAVFGLPFLWLGVTAGMRIGQRVEASQLRLRLLAGLAAMAGVSVLARGLMAT